MASGMLGVIFVCMRLDLRLEHSRQASSLDSKFLRSRKPGGESEAAAFPPMWIAGCSRAFLSRDPEAIYVSSMPAPAPVAVTGLAFCLVSLACCNAWSVNGVYNRGVIGFPAAKIADLADAKARMAGGRHSISQSRSGKDRRRERPAAGCLRTSICRRPTGHMCRLPSISPLPQPVPHTHAAHRL